MNIEQVLIFTHEPFPYGMAATNRIISYGKGFISNGKKVNIYCLKKTEKYDNVKNHKKNGTYNKIKFNYLATSTVRSMSFIKRRMDNLISLVLLLFTSLKKINSSTISIYYSSNTTALLILWMCNKLKGGVLLKEESEHPSHYIGEKKSISSFFFKKIHYKFFDVFLLMTKNLISYFESNYNTQYIHVPMTVELDRFNKEMSGNDDKDDIIIYTGVLDDKKDGTHILLKTFANIAKEYSTYRLHLYGSASSEEKLQRYYQLVNELNISDLVSFKGRVTREVITLKLMEAKMLVLPRPDSIQAQNGFPTKLGEYLATGNPTLVTSVGEIPDYLTDGKDCYMAIPGNIESLESKMREILRNYDRAKRIGLNGRKLAEKHFNNVNQTKKIIKFLENSLN